MKLQYFFAIVGTSRYIPSICLYCFEHFELVELISLSIFGILLFFDSSVSFAK
jgi:hypothetical protein